MKNTYTFFLLLIIATIIGTQISHDPGYVIFSYKHWSIETTLWLFAFFISIIFFVLHYLLLLPSKISTLSSPKKYLSLFSFKNYLVKRSALKAERFNIEKNLVHTKLSKITSAHEAIAYWKSLSRSLKREPILCESYTRLLMSTGEDDQAEFVLRKFLEHTWNNQLVFIYSELRPSNVSKQIAQLEKWLSQYPKNPTLQYAAGCLARQLAIPGKARHYFEQCITLSKDTPLEVVTIAQAYLALSSILEEMNAHEMANEISRDFLIRSLNSE